MATCSKISTATPPSRKCSPAWRAQGRIPQTILLDGAEGVGKATLARRFAATLLGDAGKIEQDDLSLEHNT